jgi:hypothetical protein
MHGYMPSSASPRRACLATACAGQSSRLASKETEILSLRHRAPATFCSSLGQRQQKPRQTSEGVSLGWRRSAETSRLKRLMSSIRKLCGRRTTSRSFTQHLKRSAAQLPAAISRGFAVST